MSEIDEKAFDKAADFLATNFEFHDTAMLRAAILAYLSARKAQGFVEVRKEPTEAMILAATPIRPEMRKYTPDSKAISAFSIAKMNCERIWRAMLTAAQENKADG